MSAISSAMKEQGVSQAELARRMNSCPAAISKALKLQVDPRASTLVAMLKALGLSLAMRPLENQPPTHT